MLPFPHGGWAADTLKIEKNGSKIFFQVLEGFSPPSHNNMPRAPGGSTCWLLTSSLTSHSPTGTNNGNYWLQSSSWPFKAFLFTNYIHDIAVETSNLLFKTKALLDDLASSPYLEGSSFITNWWCTIVSLRQTSFASSSSFTFSTFIWTVSEAACLVAFALACYPSTLSLDLSLEPQASRYIGLCFLGCWSSSV